MGPIESRIDDFDKGDIFGWHEVLDMLGVKPEEVEPGSVPPEVRLAGKLESALHKAGKPWTVKASQGCVMILTDTQAVHHNAKRHRAGIRKFKRANEGLSGVDRSSLSHEDRMKHETLSRSVAAQYMAIKSTKIEPSAMVKPVASR